MLSTMATVTSGLISPNSYGLSTDALKMAPENYHHYDNSSDSDQDTRAAATANEPKRNKRKNFKPRCSSVATTSSLAENNNRRKAQPTKMLLENRVMDLSGRTELSSSGSDSENGFAYPNSDQDELTMNSSDNEPEDEHAKIPSSFSIHNLAKPHEAAQTAAGATTQDMREYAMNTMRELLGIYGLTSEVAESISRQLPIAAFSSGKLFENLSLGAPKSHSSSPPSRPPTPPSTPLSPKSGDLGKIASQLQVAKSSSQQLPPGAAATNKPKDTSLNLSRKPSASTLTQQQQHSNGFASVFGNQQDFPLFAGLEQHLQQQQQHQLSIKAEERSDKATGGRGIFPNMAPFACLKTESNSPPPLDAHPLSAMMAQSMAPTIARDPNLLLQKTTTSQLDYSKYVKKFSSSLECGSGYCKDLNYREHFHCLDCNSRVFIKKEEMIRHFKWHKKRDESLQHGFMRYSPLDDCGDRYHGCSHNKKQTHYHCIKEGCDKVYISTSDVQMHANYHRKDSAIIQEGFQRFRATEECGASYCAFFGQRTTHFHCRRQNCRFTFKNKSDMEKHKSYHIKDEQLSRDGFKKFMKNEQCPFENCRFSKVCNHIHCIRPQCNYVLHSSGQLFSHKRKHERKDSELAYRKYKLAQSMMKTLEGQSSMNLSQFDASSSDGLNLSMFPESNSERNSPVSYDESESAIDLSANETESNSYEFNWNQEDFWRKYCTLLHPEQCPQDSCELKHQEHYHCFADNCMGVFQNRDAVREHARNHEQQEQITETYFTTANCDDSCLYHDKGHHHCTWDGCREVILAKDKPFRRLEHYKMHEYSKKLSLTKDPLTMTHLATSIDGMFCRKRGRPPKNRVIEVWNDYSPIGNQGLMDSPQAIFTSFKLPKLTSTPSSSQQIKPEEPMDSNDSDSSGSSPNPLKTSYSSQGFEVYSENTKCPDNLCPYLGSTHYHCTQNRCLYVTDKEDVLIMHSKDFHDNIEILDGFEFYDRNVDCRLSGCPSNKLNRHFHCTRPQCQYSFVQYSQMGQHQLKHLEEDGKLEQRNLGEIRVKSEAQLNDEEPQFKAINLSQSADNKISVVKASGTFYPLSTLPNSTTTTSDTKNTQIPTDDGPVNLTETQSSSTLYGPELCCSRPFCKLKRKYHYHCNLCNQAFSEIDRLVVHVAKHGTMSLNQQQPAEDNNNLETSQGSIKQEPKIQVAPLQNLQQQQQQQSFDAYQHFNAFPANLQFALMSQQPYGMYPSQLMFQHPLLAAYQPPTTDPLAQMAANLNKRSLSPHEMSPDAKKARIHNSMRILKDEPVPEGYLRFRFNEDCHYQHCGYREHQTHFHCQRQDCGYSFCDKTRFVQHTARHERLDTLMGGDFQQYRANVACGRQDCAYTANLGNTQNKASHFHCLKCEFVCTDTNKVVAHRRQHQKLDSIQAAGFEKFTPSQQCRVQNCQHGGKQTHYHCLQCQYAVLGLAQMSAHKYRHMEN